VSLYSFAEALDYDVFANVLSVVDIVLCLSLVVIAFRRTRFHDRRKIVRQIDVASNARHLEGPVVTLLLIVAIITGATALFRDSEEYIVVLRAAVQAIRGILLAVGCLIGYGYWLQRVTWR